jgi:hypothetical protein
MDIAIRGHERAPAANMKTRVAVTDSQAGFQRRNTRQIAALMALVAAILLAKNLSLESPLMAGDEYDRSSVSAWRRRP